jgi:hypothetical protein
MKRTLISCVIVLFFALVGSSPAQEGLDTTNATEGGIRGSVGIGMGSGPTGYLIVLPLGERWLDTGIDVTSGDVLIVTAVASSTHPPCDGTGCPPYRQPDDVILAGAAGWRLTSLVGRIDDAGTPFSIGKRYEGRIAESGRLFVGSNDGSGDYGDNTGAFEVTIQVTKGR